MARTTETWQVSGRMVTLTSPGKVYSSADGFTKADMLAYYRDVAAVILPYMQDRPVVMRVCPQGVQGACYYRRNLPARAPDWLRSVEYMPETTDEPGRLPIVDDAAGLLWLANQGSIEFHLWASRLPNLEQPDQIVIDLDPGDRIGFAKVFDAALHVRASLDQFGLRGYAKTSGGRGLHVVLPLAPGHTFDAVREWVKALAQELADAHPELIEVAHGATHQGSRVTLDYAQSSLGRNLAAPYTLRARPGLPVSTPLSWDEIAAGAVRPPELGPKAVLERLERMGDLFEPVRQSGQRLP